MAGWNAVPPLGCFFGVCWSLCYGLRWIHTGGTEKHGVGFLAVNLLFLGPWLRRPLYYSSTSYSIYLPYHGIIAELEGSTGSFGTAGPDGWVYHSQTRELPRFTHRSTRTSAPDRFRSTGRPRHTKDRHIFPEDQLVKSPGVVGAAGRTRAARYPQSIVPMI